MSVKQSPGSLYENMPWFLQLLFFLHLACSISLLAQSLKTYESVIPALGGHGTLFKCWTIPADGLHVACWCRESSGQGAGNTPRQGDGINAGSIHSLLTGSWSLLCQLSSLCPTPSLLLLLNHGCYLLLSSFPFSAS